VSEYVSRVAVEREEALLALREELTDEMDAALHAMQSALRTAEMRTTAQPLASNFFESLWVSVVTGIRNIDFSDENEGSGVETRTVRSQPEPEIAEEVSFGTNAMTPMTRTLATPSTSGVDVDKRLLSLQRRLSAATPSDDRCQALTRRILAKDSLIAALRSELNAVHDKLRSIEGFGSPVFCWLLRLRSR
jgi:hypothetical protein